MKKIVIVFIVILLLFIVAAMTKPSESHFENFLNEHFAQNKSDDLFTKGAKSLVKIQSKWTNEYEDKIFFARAHTKIVNKKFHFIGAFGFWIKIN